MNFENERENRTPKLVNFENTLISEVKSLLAAYGERRSVNGKSECVAINYGFSATGKSQAALTIDLEGLD